MYITIIYNYVTINIVIAFIKEIETRKNNLYKIVVSAYKETGKTFYIKYVFTFNCYV